MSGKRQHFIPRFLLDGFASHRSGDEVFAWVYRKDRAPFNTNTRNIGVEGSFYNDGSDSEADDLITTGEQAFSALLARLRATSGPIQDSDGIANLIAHFEIRTRHVRQSYANAAGSLLERLLCDETQPLLVQQLLQSLTNDPSYIRDALREEILKRGIPEPLAEPIYELVKPILPQVLPRLLTQLPLILSQMRLQMPGALAGGAKRGQITVLKETLAPQLRVDRYRKLAYRVVKTPSASIPLGDSVVAFQTAGERPFKPTLEANDDLRGVYLPIAADTVVIGGQCAHSPLDPANLRDMIVRCSLEFFVAKDPPGDTGHLTKDIGTYTGLLSSADINTLLAKVLGDPSGD